ncbi:GtrA family protein [Aliihoeflea aestuarii]|jgi:putative flippase GtrA|uniref:GtrA family protein n=1 Tax=Aliihoeflea aestuarii TaxID=453840 RepID=UPI003557FD1B
MHRIVSLDAVIANAIGYFLATAFNYVANFYWAFRTRRSHAQATWRFLVVVFVGVILNALYAVLLASQFDVPVEIIATSFALLWPMVSFVALRMWALRG